MFEYETQKQDREQATAMRHIRSADYDPASKPERSGCLLTFLTVAVAYALINTVGLITVLGTLLNRNSPSTFSVILLFTISITSLVCLWGMIRWKRWAVYGLGLVSIAYTFLQVLLNTATIPEYFAPFVQIGFLYFAVAKQWDYFT